MLQSTMPSSCRLRRRFGILRRRVRAGLAAIPNALLGYDIFISYSRRDGKKYAATLQSELRNEGFRCFLDEGEMSGGDQLRPSIARALRRSRVLVLVATERAVLHSKFVRGELSDFAAFKRPIIPVNVAGALSVHLAQSPLEKVLRDRIWIDDTGASSGEVPPSPNVAAEIERTFSFIRRARIRQAFAWSLAAIFGLLAAAAEMQRRAAEINRKAAVSRQLAAQSTSTRGEQFDLSLLLGLAALEVSNTGEANSAILNALLADTGLVRYLRGHAAPVIAVDADLDGWPIVSGAEDGEVRIGPIQSCLQSR